MSRSKQNTRTSKTVTIIFHKDYGQYIWGIFSSEKKALKAINRWKLSPDQIFYSTITVDYRLRKQLPVYVSDPIYVGPTTLAELHSIPIVGGDATADTRPLDNSNELPTFEEVMRD